jgi:hypothetical protein
VVANREDADFEALRKMSKGFADNGADTYIFDNLRDPEEDRPELEQKIRSIAHDTEMHVIDVSKSIWSDPAHQDFVCLDGIHMKEPYHRLMAKEWLKVVVGGGGAESH